jgi:hypothetical protein
VRHYQALGLSPQPKNPRLPAAARSAAGGIRSTKYATRGGATVMAARTIPPGQGLDHFTFASPPAAVRPGEPFSVTVYARTGDEQTLPNYSGRAALLIPRFGILATRKYDEPNSPGEGTRPTITTAFVGRVPSPGVSLIFRGIRKSEDRLLIRTCFAAQVRPHGSPLNSAVAGPCPMIKRNKQ